MKYGKREALVIYPVEQMIQHLLFAVLCIHFNMHRPCTLSVCFRRTVFFEPKLLQGNLHSPVTQSLVGRVEIMSADVDVNCIINIGACGRKGDWFGRKVVVAVMSDQNQYVYVRASFKLHGNRRGPELPPH